MPQEQTRYIVQFNDAERGPFTLAELEDMLSQKILTPLHSCSPDSYPRSWKPLSKYLPSSLARNFHEQGETPVASKFTPLTLSVITVMIAGGIFLLISKISSRTPNEAPDSTELSQEITFENLLTNPRIYLFAFGCVVVLCTALCAVFAFSRVNPKK